MFVFLYIQPLDVQDLVPDFVLQGGQDPQLSVDLDLHLCDSPAEVLGQVIVVVVATWWKNRRNMWMN